MNRETAIKKRRDANIVDEQLNAEYLNSLKKPYVKKGVNKCFYDQFDNGSGNELEEKFWSPISSSRFAFEMYSWLAPDERIVDVEFELKLIGVTSQGVPNMDVYIELSDEIIFIESKFTEQYKQSIECDSLPGAYWKELGDKDALTTKGERIGTTLLRRYHNDREALSEFLNFIKFNRDNLAKLREEEKPNCWMEYSQEIKHLYGIYFYLKKHKELHNKKVSFYNIYYYLEDNVNDAIKAFFDEGNKMMNRLLSKFNVCFNYLPLTAQEVAKKFPKNIRAFGKEENVRDILNQQFLLNI